MALDWLRAQRGAFRVFVVGVAQSCCGVGMTTYLQPHLQLVVKPSIHLTPHNLGMTFDEPKSSNGCEVGFVDHMTSTKAANSQENAPQYFTCTGFRPAQADAAGVVHLLTTPEPLQSSSSMMCSTSTLVGSKPSSVRNPPMAAGVSTPLPP